MMTKKNQMREHELNSKEMFIRGYYLDDTSICDKLIEYYQNDSEKIQGVVSVKDEIKVDKTIKDCSECSLREPLAIEYFKYLQLCVDEYIKEYEYCNRGAPWKVVETVNIQHYYPAGGYYSWHCEKNSSIFPFYKRHLVFMTYLNDVTDQGETEFYHQKLKVKPEKGLTLIWPPDWTFIHRGITSPSQEKYITTGWFSYY